MQGILSNILAICLHINRICQEFASKILKNPCIKLVSMTEDELQTRVIANIRALRKKAALSQEKLADKADISRQMMNDIEGRRRWLTKGTLVKLANALEVDVHELFIPCAEENLSQKAAYDAITKKVVLQVKDAINKALENL